MEKGNITVVILELIPAKSPDSRGRDVQRPSTASFFQKSKVAVPELAGSVEENWKSLLDKNYKFINEKKLKHFIESIMALLDQFCIVNLYGQWSLYGQIWKIFHFNSG